MAPLPQPCYLANVSTSLRHALLSRRILVCVGSGGVGKTTTAASLALAAARRGKKTLVLTIDPAKRLANSLGLPALGHQVQQVPQSVIAAATAAVGDAAPATGELHAMMLDQKAAFDEVVARYAKDPAAVHRILQNPVYGQISKSLAGAQEYAAMAKLHEFDQSGQWDLIVVDTPPTAHALDFLDAPQKLSEAIDSPAIEWFRKLKGGSGSRWSLVGKTGSLVLGKLATFVGSKFIDDLGVFFTEFNDILGGFQHRAAEVFTLLRQSKVGFVLVASPEPMAMREALYFHDRLRAAQMPFVGFAINKVHTSMPLPFASTSAPPSSAAGPAPLATASTPPSPTDTASHAAAIAHIAQTLASVPQVEQLALSGTSLRIASEALFGAHRAIEARALGDRQALATLRKAGGPDTALVTVPFLHGDVHSIERLVGLERYLLAA